MTVRPRPRLLHDDAAGRAEAIAALRRGSLVALPTDTVYGLAVALDAAAGLDRLFAAKGRPPDKGVVLLLADHRQADEVARLDAAAHVLAAAFWPGGLTLVLAQRPDVPLPAELTGGAGSVGVRLAAHDAPRSLARALGPLPVTSANRSGEPDAIDAAGVLARLGHALDLAIVLDGGPARGGVPSSVVDCSAGPARLLRAGAIPLDALAAVLDEAELEHRLRD
jgi:L-threonylcarbamoyladenylate synthase